MTDFDDFDDDLIDVGDLYPYGPVKSALWPAWERIRHPLTYGQRAPGLCREGCGDAETHCPGCTSLQCLNCRPCECGEAHGRLGP